MFKEEKILILFNEKEQLFGEMYKKYKIPTSNNNNNRKSGLPGVVITN